MKIKKLIVSSLQEAVEEVRNLYGPDATILSTKIVKKRLIPFLPYPSRSQLEVTIGIPDTEDFPSHLKVQESVYEEINKLKESLREVVELVRRQKVESDEEIKPLESEYSLRALNLMNKLMNRGMTKDVAKAIVDASCGYDYELRKLDLKGETFESLKIGLESTIPILKSFEEDLTDFKVITLIGPTGVGKTTTVAKLAYIIKELGRRVGVITIDSYRVSAVQQLKTFTDIMELPFRKADTPQRFRECIEELSSMDVVLVDTGGRSHYDELKVKELVPFFNKLPALEVYFTISANMDERVMVEALERFSVLPVNGLIFTKMDETVYYGYILNLVYRTRIPILCFTTGQRVPKDIVMADYNYIAGLFLKVEE
ncbi:flagellar biosynthesis protein FlhF [Thermocrinis sp.]